MTATCEILPAVWMKSQVFREGTTCRLLENNRRFGGKWFIHLQIL